MPSEAGRSPGAARRWGAILARPVVIRAIVAVAGGIVAVLWPERTLDVVVLVAGIALVVSGAVELPQMVRRRDQAGVVRDVTDVAFGIVLVLVRRSSAEVLTVALALFLVGRGLVDLYRAARMRADLDDLAGWYALRGIIQVAAGVLTITIVDRAVEVLVVSVGLAWIVSGVLSLVHAVRRDPDVEPPRLEDTPETLLRWLRTRDLGEERRAVVTDKLSVELRRQPQRVWRFVILMALSTAIAALGVVADSTAVVIGAMLVAPLMTPILGTSAGILRGDAPRTLQSLALVGTGAAIGIGLSFLISYYLPAIVSTTSNAQITSRTSPTLLDLAIAIAAGAAGGYATCKEDVADSLPGVAIAVALVPPLAVVGITLEAGEGDAAGGAMLLFLTNLVGILAASGVVFVLVGYSPWSILNAHWAQLRRSYATVAVALMVIAVPLFLTGEQILTEATRQQEASTIVDSWLQATPEYDEVELSVDGRTVTVVLLGDTSTRSPDVDQLHDQLEAGLDEEIKLIVRVVPQREFEVGG